MPICILGGGALGLRETDLTRICTLQTIQKAVGAFVALTSVSPAESCPSRRARRVSVSTRWCKTGLFFWAPPMDTGPCSEVCPPAGPGPQSAGAGGGGMPLPARPGITSLEDARGDEETISLFTEFAQAGKLTVRTAIALSLGPLSDKVTLREWAAHKGRFPRLELRVAAFTMMMDGVIESHPAAMLEPNSNKAVWTQPKFNANVARADQLGLQMCTHAIGGRAVRMALDGYEHARRVNWLRDS